MTPDIKMIDLLPFASSDNSFMMATAAAVILTAPMLVSFYSLRNLLPATTIFIVFWAFMMSGLNVYIFAVGPAIVFGCLSAVLFNGLRGRSFGKAKSQSEERLEELRLDREAFAMADA